MPGNDKLKRIHFLKKIFKKEIRRTPLISIVVLFNICILGAVFLSATHLHAFIPIQSGKKPGVPKMVFKSLIYDAGLVEPGEIVQGVFVVENKGDAELIIEDVQPT